MSVFTVALAHEDGWLRDALCEHAICFRSSHASFWNRLFYDLSMGTLVSIVFYWLLVRVPEAKNRRQIKQSLRMHHLDLKRESVLQLLFAANGGSVSVDLYSGLMANPVAFREYFYKDHRQKWYDAMNAFDYGEGGHLAATTKAISEFQGELNFALGQTLIGDDRLFHQLKGLEMQLRDAASVRAGTNSIDMLFGTLQLILGGWTGNGTVDFDPIGAMIAKL